MPLTCPDLLGPALCRAVDIYCERTSPALDAEPLNTLSNLAFLVAAWAAWRLHPRAAPAARATLNLLAGLIALVGLGSALFHIVATRWAEWADVIPIVAFMLAYLWVAMAWLFGLGAWTRAALIAAFAAITFALEAYVPSTVLWGGALYLPSLLVALVVVIALRRRHHPAAIPMAVAVATFLLAYAARSLDSPVCAALPIGTHYLWHILDATFMFLLVRLAILHGTPVARR